MKILGEESRFPSLAHQLLVRKCTPKLLPSPMLQNWAFTKVVEIYQPDEPQPPGQEHPLFQAHYEVSVA